MVRDLFPALRRQRQTDVCKFKASMVYTESSRTASSTQRDPIFTPPPKERYI